ncbi:uncharacterized protein LOC120328943 [Styela clava]
MDIRTAIRISWIIILLVSLYGGLSYGYKIPSTSVATTLHDEHIPENTTLVDAERTMTMTETREPSNTKEDNVKKTTPHTPITPGELDDIIFEKMKEVESARRKCIYGEFYSFALKTCQLCITKCENHTNMDLCGIECNEYFQNEDRKSESAQNLLIASCLGGVAFALTITLTVSCCILLKRVHELNERIKTIEDRNRGAPDGDKKPFPVDSEMENENQESGQIDMTGSNTPLIPPS